MPRLALLLLSGLLLSACQPTAPVSVAAGGAASAAPGQPLAGLSPDQLAQFDRGQAAFSRLFNPRTGLGPLFNDNSCRACHGEVASGGHSERTAFLVGANLDGGPSLLEHLGGPVIQDAAVLGTPTEQVPAIATSVSRRISPAVWGLGLVEAIPEEAIMGQMAPSDEKLALGIRGIANWEEGQLGRFGAKAQKSDLKGFTEQAFDWEMGISTPDRPFEQQSNGPPQRVATPDISQETLLDVVFYQRYLAPPPRGETSLEAEVGERTFQGLGCAHCHTPALTTGPNAHGIPEGLPVQAYSDFLLHLMDEEMQDYMTQGAATGQMWRTTPLWGLRFRKRYMHDGRATTLDEAIGLHGGEAAKVRDRYTALTDAERQAVKAFLNSL